jgi:uncharacterized membrane protein YfcA
MDLMLVVAGAITGFLVGLTGVGGGALMTPLLLLLFGVAPLTAVGTDLWFAAITKMFATRVHHNHSLIDWPVVRRLWLGSLSASVLTLVWMKLPPGRRIGSLLSQNSHCGSSVANCCGYFVSTTVTSTWPKATYHRCRKF